MSALYQSLLLFGLNALDAQLTLFWVRANLATEGNGLMARLLEMGDAPFLGFKLFVGAFAALILYRCYSLPLARHGLKAVLGIYLALMFVHAATGLSALGFDGPETAIGFLSNLPNAALALFS
ncbi:MAG: hypothetical protein ICV60_06365 [Pyrinomonadaceae bacterium]|nr:hypothetical protein [Pyrinomonadaceae bacterium]